MAVCGAEFEVTCDDRPPCRRRVVRRPRAGQRLKFGRVVQGARAYLAVAGGMQTPPVLGSRATHLVSAMGGFNGRALQAGDRVPIGRPRRLAPRRKASA